MSQEQVERIAILEANYKNMDEKLDGILKRFDEFDKKLDCALDKKANIWVEKVLIFLGSAIALSLLSYFGYLIVKVIEL